MPLMAPSDPPGFAPPQTVVAPEVFEQMRIYMNCADLEERNIREARMRKTLQELSNDPIGNVLAYALRKHQCCPLRSIEIGGEFFILVEWRMLWFLHKQHLLLRNTLDMPPGREEKETEQEI
ncbi:unnamed protein product [Brassica oleracea var. botrytis]|uniref:Uncharacterized protein n=3 Tax=Brassica TaxID=3705 RepID=A0A3P6C104_BRAOL|nr:unnamed protein product [Brassica napus]VDD08836.1 unnamed protein product [Brassica oleracea]